MITSLDVSVCLVSDSFDTYKVIQVRAFSTKMSIRPEADFDGFPVLSAR